MKVYSILFFFVLGIYSLNAQTWISFADSCFTSAAVGTSFINSADLINNNADLMSWVPATSTWTGSWPNANLHTPPPDSLSGCHAIFCGNGVTWTTGGEGFGLLMNNPLVSGTTYSFGVTYVSDGFGSTGAFAPFIYTSNSTLVPSGTLVGSLPPAGYTWLTSTYTFTASPAQNGDTWLMLFTGPTGTSGIVNSFCPACQAVTACNLHVNLGPDSTICAGQELTLNAGVFAGATYQWQDGSSGDTLAVSNPGTYWVHVTRGVCAASDTVRIDTMPLPVVNLGNDTSICFSDTLVLVAGTPGPNYHWQNNSASNVYDVTATGDYSVTVSSGGCSRADTVSVTVLPLPGVSVADTTVCANQQVTLTAIPADSGGTYRWSPGGATTQSISVNVGATSTYTVTYSTAICGSAVDSATVTVSAGPVVSVNDTTICAGRSAMLTATPTLGGGTYSWTPGGASTQSITVNPASTTSYTVTYSTAHCGTAVGSGTVTVTPAPVVSVNDTSVCAGQGATLTATPAPVGGTYSWSPGAGATQSITVSPAATTTYTVTYTIAGCGTAIDSGVVTITQPPTVAMGADTTICLGASAILTATSSLTGGTFSWTPGGASASSVTVSPSVNTTYTVTYTVTGCTPASGSQTVSIYPAISIALTADNPTCPATSDGIITSAILPAAGYTYHWSNNNITTANDSNLSAGPYYLTVTDSHGCTASDSAAITAPAAATLEILPPDTTVMQGSAVQLTSVFGGYPVSAITSYSWTPATGLSCTNCANPLDTTGANTDTLTVFMLTVTYNSGCSVTASDTVRMAQLALLATPNAFTPNGDSKNDEFVILANGTVSEFSMSIYNRWGQLIFISADITKGWDGSYQGVAQPVDDYMYYYSIRYENGKTEYHNGTLRLMR